MRPLRKMTLFRIMLAVGMFCVGVAAQSRSEDKERPVRPHSRIEKEDVLGSRVHLQSVKGAVLFTTPKFRGHGRVALIVHFHGAPWLVERHIAEALPHAAIVTVQLGAGSSAYGRPFSEPELFKKMLVEVRKELGYRGAWSSITLTGFSAGYGAVRAILRQPSNYQLITNVLLLDGIHAGYEPEGKGLLEGGSIASTDLDSFISFAKDAAEGKKTFVLTHSEIVPETYASTSECVDHLLAGLDLTRSPAVRKGPMDMQLISSVRRGRFNVFGYAGNSAADHVDHLHAMPFWLRFLKI